MLGIALIFPLAYVVMLALIMILPNKWITRARNYVFCVFCKRNKQLQIRAGIEDDLLQAKIMSTASLKNR